MKEFHESEIFPLDFTFVIFVSVYSKLKLFVNWQKLNFFDPYSQ